MLDTAETAWRPESIRSLFDPATGHLDRRVFSDEALYRLELQNIFARAWNFMCHESQIPEAGDYFINYIGEDQVIVVRDGEGKVNVLLNTCRHRGNALCRAEQGNTRSFVCSYHGWNYALNGDLIGVPGQKTYFHDRLEKGRLGLAKAAQVDSIHGFIFATLSSDAPPLLDYLGDVGRTGLGMVAAHGDVIVLDGIQKNVVGCNWKIAVDNLFDWYHVMYSHASATSSGFTDLSKILYPNQQFVMLGEYGHAISGPGLTGEEQDGIDRMSDEDRELKSRTMPPGSHRLRPRAAKELMGPAGVRSIGHPNIFPNLWITLSGLQMCLRLPRGPNATELWWFTIVPKSAPPAFRNAVQRMAVHLFGPAGLLEQDDGENWSQATRSARGLASRALGQTLQMGLGEDEVTLDNSGQRYIETCINEHGQRWHYRAWTEWMTAKDWEELKAESVCASHGAGLMGETMPESAWKGMAADERMRLQYAVEQFLYAEAALLDGREYRRWLALLAPDIHYWMPIRRTVTNSNLDREFTRPGDMAFFDDDRELLEVRVKKLEAGSAWSEDPPSRSRHFLSNVRIVDVIGEDITVEACFHLYRSRLNSEADSWTGRRVDVLRRQEDGFLIAKRHLFLDQTVIRSTNMSTLF